MKKKKLSREAWIGIYGVCMLLLLYLGINFIKSQDIFSRDNVYYAVYDNADDIAASSPVTIKGFRVGTVDRVWYDVPTGKVITEFSVKRDYPLPADSRAKIASASLMGATVIDLQLGNADRILADGDTVSSLIEPGLTQALGDFKTKADTLLEQLSQALTGVNAVLSDRNVANLSALLAHANSIGGNLDRMVAGDLNRTMTNLRSLSAELNTAAPKINRIVDRVENIADTMSLAVPPLMTNLAQTAEKLNAVMQAINEGQGSAGKLIYDRELYDNLTEASESLTLLLQDLKANPGRYIHISVFGGNRNK